MLTEKRKECKPTRRNNNNKLRPHLPVTTPVGYCSAGKAGDRTPA